MNERHSSLGRGAPSQPSCSSPGPGKLLLSFQPETPLASLPLGAPAPEVAAPPHPVPVPCASRQQGPCHWEVLELMVGLPRQKLGAGSSGRSSWALHPHSFIPSLMHPSRFLPFPGTLHLSLFARLACLGCGGHLAQGAKLMTERERTVEVQNWRGLEMIHSRFTPTMATQR